MRRKLNIASGFLSCVFVSFLLISCSEPKVVDTWEGGEHDVAVKVETLEDGDTRVQASYGNLEDQT